MTSLLEQTDKTVVAVEKNDIEAYSLYISEANDTSSYIHEETLSLINNELSNYKAIDKLLDKKITYMKKMAISILVVIILLSILFALWFSNGITSTIERLSLAAKEISARRYMGEDVVVSTKDELWFLTKTFNEMKRNIQESMSEIEEKARMGQLLKEMELKSLQNQINPHFLFNTLNTISKTSLIEGAEKTSDLISSISTLLRYNISSLDRKTLLKDEVKIVNEYFLFKRRGLEIELSLSKTLIQIAFQFQSLVLHFNRLLKTHLFMELREWRRGPRLNYTFMKKVIWCS